MPSRHHPDSESAPLKDIKSAKKLCGDAKTTLSAILLDYDDDNDDDDDDDDMMMMMMSVVLIYYVKPQPRHNLP